MIELPLIFAAGFLGSSHCIGMCGPFALLLGSSSSTWNSNLSRQLLYSVGRIFTYTMLGAAVGFGGMRFSAMAPSLINVPAILSIVAGLFLIYQGLATLGLVRFPTVGKGSSTCLAGGLLAGFLRSTRRSDVFLAGLFTGFMPCGLVYGFLGMAASTQSMAMGACVMLVFGFGTVPIMVATGIGGNLLSLAKRKQLLRFAACCLVLAGLITVVRGASFIGLASTQSPAEACPLCP